MSKLSRLRDNIAVIEYMLTGKGDGRNAGYTGFGGLGFILNPADRSAWSKSDMQYYADTMRLQRIIRENSKDEKTFNRLWQSLKASTLTAFYTPYDIVAQAMLIMFGDGRKGEWIKFKSMLDPAAGDGIFMTAACMACRVIGLPYPKFTAYEKDLLTAQWLKHEYDDMRENYNVYNTAIHADGFETIPQDSLGQYDLVSTNVPFGDIKVFDEAYTHSNNKVRRDAAKMIHRYYVLKGLDCLRDGGVEAYIITSNYLNHDDEQIAEALKQARLVGAYRLANNLFKENGTEVGTDLLVLQKDVNKQTMTADETFLLSQYEDDGCPTNLYFDMHPDHIIATDTERDTDAYGKPGFVYTHKDGVAGIAKDIAAVMSKDMAVNLDVRLFNEGEAKTHKSESKQEKQTASKKAQDMEAIYDTYKQLYDYEAEKLEENDGLRRELNDKYDAFVKEYGAMNAAKNKAMAKIVNKELLALEVKEGRGWRKADIFAKPVAFSMDDIHGADTPQEALAQSLNDKGYPDMQYMSALTGMDEQELLLQLDGSVYWNPIDEDYEIAARFISGNVVEKIDEIRLKYDIDKDDEGQDALARQNIDPRVIRSLRALEDAVPAFIPFEELDFNLGERWIDCKLYSDFGSEFFSIPSEKKDRWGSNIVKVTVHYNPMIDQFVASADSIWNEKIRSQYAVKSECSEYNGMDLFVHALQNTCPKMMRYQRDEYGCKVVRERANGDTDYVKEEDPEKTQLANSKIEEMRNGWVEWLTRQPKELRDKLANQYNRRFNCFVKPKYDGSHQRFPGLDFKGLEKKYGIKSLYQSQKDCIWMLVQNQGGICDHEVGSGKTLIMCIAAHEMKRLGIVHKPMIIGLKANVGAIAETYQTAYPQARILYATNKDFHEAERVDFFNRMKNNDYDCVIMSHDQFGRLPQSEEVQASVMEDELKQLEDAMRLAHEYDWSNQSRMLKGLERRKRNLESKLYDLRYSIAKHKDDVVDFKRMGIDHIFVDESHMFKNLGFSTRHDRVAGLGNTEGSKRAFNLLMAIRTIQQRTGRDLGATFLSGTTVTNSLTELYSLFRYLRPKALAKQGITCFDAWAAIFTKKSTEFEFGLTNQIILKERFRYFIKVPELAQFYNEITDYRTAEDVGIERPAKHARLLNIEPTPDQAEFIHTLMEFAKTGDFSLIGKDDVTDAQRRAKMLYATDMARKMALDMRMIDPTYSDHPRTKSSMCAKLVKQYYDKYDSVKGTQLIFSDLSTYQGKNKGWNVYEDIKQKLVEMGIPSSEIRFIQECKSESTKQKMIDDVNDGKIRVLFGSTSMLGTGVNAQKRVVCVHHLDTPWRPSDLEQRDGRAIRKGNEIAKLYANNTVDVIIYAVRRSLDAYKFGLLNNKQTFINQLKRGQLSVRTLDEGAMDEKSGMNFAEYMAVLSGNTDLLDRAKLEKRIAALEAERKSFYREKADQEKKREWLRENNEKLERNIADAQSDMERFNAAVQTDADGNAVNAIAIDGFKFDGKPEDFDKAVGEVLVKIDRTARTNGLVKTIGNIYGFPISVRTKQYNYDGTTEFANIFSVRGSRNVYLFNAEGKSSGRVNRLSSRLTGQMALKALLRVPRMISGWQQMFAENDSHIHQLDAIINIAWGKDDELANLRKELSALDLKINQSLNNGKDDGYEKKAAA